jgi:hypothetical protein
MKKLILLLLLLVNAYIANAQYKKMLADSNHYWYQFNEVNSSNSPYKSSLYQLKIVKDSTINNKNYHKIA